MNAHLKRLTNALSDTNPADLLERPASEERVGRASSGPQRNRSPPRSLMSYILLIASPLKKTRLQSTAA